MPSIQGHESRAAFSEAWRNDVDRMGSSSNEENSQALIRMVRDLIYNIARRHSNTRKSIVLLDWDLHDLWYTLITAAGNCDTDSADQDKLASYILMAKEFGALVPPAPENDVDAGAAIPLAATSGGIVFVELPYLATDLGLFWSTRARTLSSTFRRNVSAFTARLVALGVQDRQLVADGISLMRETLESQETTQGFDLSELLPVAMVWITHARHKLVMLAREGLSLSEGKTLPGDLAQAYGIKHNTLSLSRWNFWKHRLTIIEESLGSSLKASVSQCLRDMRFAEEDVGILN